MEFPRSATRSFEGFGSVAFVEIHWCSLLFNSSLMFAEVRRGSIRFVKVP